MGPRHPTPGLPDATDRGVPSGAQRLDLWGWILFLLCAQQFTAAGQRDGDVLITVGSVLFLVACVLLPVPQLRR